MQGGNFCCAYPNGASEVARNDNRGIVEVRETGLENEHLLLPTRAEAIGNCQASRASTCEDDMGASAYRRNRPIRIHSPIIT